MEQNPLAQFIITPLIKLDILGIDISITNASLVMMIATLAIIALFCFIDKADRPIPTKMHLVSETIYQFISKMLEDNVGKEGKQFIPFIFCLFIFILFCNLLGLIPHSYAVTSQIAVTFMIAMIVFITVIIAGFVKQGSHFLAVLMPRGTPLWLAPLIIIIELFVFLARPVSLSLRLAANIVAGHVLTEVLAGFVVALPLYAKFLPIPLLVAVMGFEIFVAILQAYIFSVLSCVYLSEAVNGH